MKELFLRLQKDSKVDILIRVITVLALLYFFLIGVKLLSSSMSLLGAGFGRTLLNITSNPFSSLMSGMLATVLFQSSSLTTSLIVGLVAAGSMSVGGSIPMIMGANLGTSVTNTLVSLGYIKEKENYKKAFAAATIHDFFNIMSVAIVLPIELATGILEKMSVKVAHLLYGSVSGVKFNSPIKAAIKPPVKFVKNFIINDLNVDKQWAGIVLVVIAASIVIFALTYIVKTMNIIIVSNKAEIIQKILSRNTFATILFGMLLTISVQSSSITTSLLVPMAGAGLVNLEVIFAITIGANIGTTTTALLAALTGNVAGLSIALVHFFFNLIGALLLYPNRRIRNLPIRLSQGLANYIDRSRFVGLGYIASVFFALPLSMIFIFK